MKLGTRVEIRLYPKEFAGRQVWGWDVIDLDNNHTAPWWVGDNAYAMVVPVACGTAPFRFVARHQARSARRAYKRALRKEG